MITSFSEISPLKSPISNHLERQASRKCVCFCTCTLSSMYVAQKDRILYYGWSQDQCQSQSFKWQPIQRRPYVFSGFSESCYPRFTVTLNPVIFEGIVPHVSERPFTALIVQMWSSYTYELHRYRQCSGNSGKTAIHLEAETSCCGRRTHSICFHPTSFIHLTFKKARVFCVFFVVAGPEL